MRVYTILESAHVGTSFLSLFLNFMYIDYTWCNDGRNGAHCYWSYRLHARPNMSQVSAKAARILTDATTACKAAHGLPTANYTAHNNYYNVPAPYR